MTRTKHHALGTVALITLLAALGCPPPELQVSLGAELDDADAAGLEGDGDDDATEEIVDLAVVSWSCTDCVGLGFTGGERSDWTVELENTGTVTLSYVPFELRLVPDEFVHDACGGSGDYEYYDAGSFVVTGECLPFRGGDTCTVELVDIPLPDAPDGAYKWAVVVDGRNDFEEVDEDNNAVCSDPWLTIHGTGSGEGS